MTRGDAAKTRELSHDVESHRRPARETPLSSDGPPGDERGKPMSGVQAREAAGRGDATSCYLPRCTARALFGRPSTIAVG
jgi:hypothetical protein